MRTRKRKGSSMVLIILFVTLMVSFALLSISSTNSSLKLSQRLAERVSGYYDLESLTNKSLSIVVTAIEEGGDVFAALQDGDMMISDFESNYLQDKNRIKYVVEGDDNRKMQVEIEICRTSPKVKAKVVAMYELQMEFDQEIQHFNEFE